MDEKRWRARVQRHFEYLVADGFEPVDSGKTNWETWVRYASRTAAVRVALSGEFGRVDVELIRLREGQVPEEPIWLTNAPVDRTLLDNVVEARRPDLLPTAHAQKGVDDVATEKQLAFWAETLREVAPDFLAGSMPAIDDAEAVVRARVEKHPETMTVWMPKDASDKEIVLEVADLVRRLPSEVAFRLRKYLRLGPPRDDDG